VFRADVQFKEITTVDGGVKGEILGAVDNGAGLTYVYESSEQNECGGEDRG
jgi:hypothetical protein